ncbi:MAG: hypothetical protein A2Y03_02945 [Omnitrophica WOR_2 bacterium GWF2_38_59]|nr:MAG: hypothetical protein A2Y03_02945 [Omnitrophica WOR_2 bacterium GWF2_38_59]OGX48673.1 MAG: hypothetical protein A2243_09830 [Omnitrophica WOR_2 bacterium RIFOXYA2_FULL_38_17]OGX57209.1 MAG: hypothetical protein A2306_01770 [Omnitrophica WOR_2 bacterium RIFOXYB2_FULL_38_16]OGX59294.1 MAG: hypothetical protein A2447_10560 [Omnitrophica WOR_2 bacterium RIFOXYC2_FULL_38_12]
MKFELNSLPRNCSDEEVLAEILRVDSLVGKEKLIRADFDRYAKISSSGVCRKFKKSWKEVLRLAGIEHKYSGKSVTGKMKKQDGKRLADQEILDEMKRVASMLKSSILTTQEFNENSIIISSFIVRTRFGSWKDALEKAGLKASSHAKDKFSEEECFENLLNIWTHYGRPPYYLEMRKLPSNISPNVYARRWGSWRKALEAFVNKMSQDDDEPKKQKILPTPDKTTEKEIRQDIKKHSVLSEDRYEIKLGLRYKVLDRDKFKCVRCGASPATDHSCCLHVDHKVPFSKGGRTILNNLQTLCEKCNLGKGNRYSE